jgi:hypothetical protein
MKAWPRRRRHGSDSGRVRVVSRLTRRAATTGEHAGTAWHTGDLWLDLLGRRVRDHLVPALAVLEVRGANRDDGMSAATWRRCVTLPARHALWRRGCPFPFELGNLIKLWFKNFELSEPTFEFTKL